MPKQKRSNPFEPRDWWDLDSPTAEPKWLPLELEELKLLYPDLADDLDRIVFWGWTLNPYTVRHLKTRIRILKITKLRITIDSWAKTITGIAAALAVIYAAVRWLIS